MFTKSTWKPFWELFRESIIVQSLVTLGMVTTICVMYLMERPVPQELWAAAMLILGFWFGSKTAFTKRE